MGQTLIALDTAPIIYYIEAHPEFGPKIRPILDAIIQGEINATISSLAHTELLTLPLKNQNEGLIGTYDQLLRGTKNLHTQPVTTEIARAAAVLRANYGLRTPDAIHVATAILTNAECFITNDQKLSWVQEIKVLTIEDL
jgi:predicted nucleic acid-binding protein